ncbi:MAG: FliM/FliN family flagellar motor switch protein [Planctomycetaceae bacterium]|nr:FliM/FliN family flagellar motor switch protein [Planctomycetaceae bacterium]
MSGGTAYRPVDFRKPRSEAALPRPLAQWQDRMCALAAEAWNKHLPSPVRWSRARHEITAYSQAVEKLPDPGVGFVMTIGDDPFPTIWAFAPQNALSLSADLLGNLESDWPKSRALTAVEESLMQLLMSELAWALGEAWPGRQSIACRPGDFDSRVSRSRLFARPDQMIVSEFQISTRLGEFECSWLIPQVPFEQLTSVEWPKDPQTDEPKSATPGIERLAAGLPITLSVQLGTARLPMAQLADLHIGDVVVLDQCISQPVLADIHGANKYRGYPGRIGVQRSFQIVDVLDTGADERTGGN